MTSKTALVLLVASSAAASLLLGCTSPNKNDDLTGDVRASLHRAKDCGGLLGDLKADAKFKMNKGIDVQIRMIGKCIERNGDDKCAYGGYAFGDARGGGESNGALPPQDSGSSTTPTTSGTPKASDYSQTNVQVQGVDEADIVKTDGSNLYLLHGRALKVIKAWPASDLKELASTDIEGEPSEMYVANGKAVVYSQVNGANIYTAAGVQPKQQYQDWYYTQGGGPVGEAGGTNIAPSDPRGGPVPGGQSGPYIPLTKITVLALDGASPQVLREVYFEGSYLDSRRVDNQVRSVLEDSAHGPVLKYSIYELYAPPPPAPGQTAAPVDPSVFPQTGSQMISALERLRAVNATIIDSSVLGDWLPYTFVKDGAGVKAQTVACEDFYVPTVGSTESGLTEVASIDLGDPTSLPRETAILGRADTVYGSKDTLYLAARAWIEPPFVWYDDSGSGSAESGSGTVGSNQTQPAPAPPPTSAGGTSTKSLHPRSNDPGPGGVVTWATNKTHLHKFEFATNPKFPNYVASGTVLGDVKDQYSLDDKDGFLRVATTEDRMYMQLDGQYFAPTAPQPGGAPPIYPSSMNHVFVLGMNGPWLDVVGDSGDLAANERIYSVRFLGNRGYVTTFRQVDPLFVLDLAQPQKPSILGALTIPGFSEYMHPLDETHLFTIGRDASNTGHVSALQLKIFDVSNGAAPQVVQSFTYSSSTYGSSEAEYNPKAFTYFDDRGLLAFPYYAYDGVSNMRSSLELFKVDAKGGFAKLGSIDHTPLVSQDPNGYYCGYFSPEVRRGVFLESFVFSVSYGGVIAKDSSNLGAAGVTMPLGAPLENQGYGPSCAAD